MKKDGYSRRPAAPAAGSLAMVEKKKKQQPAAGCIAVFLDLFAKKRKFFPRKLLPPPPPPPPPPPISANAGGAGEKLPVPKMLLIKHEENSATVVKDEAGGGMRAPGVVARLMGLDAVPAPAVGRQNRSIVMLPEKAELAQESRPRKMQKTGQLLENWSSRSEEATTAAAMASSSRRRSDHTLASPVKSPRSPICGGRNRARLIGAAAKILEPGLRPRALPPPSPLAHLEFSGNDREGSDEPGGALEPRSSCEGKREIDCENFTLSDLSNSCPSHDGPGDNRHKKKKTPIILRGLNRASSSSPLPDQCSGNERSSSPVLRSRSRTTSPVARASIDIAEDKTNVCINQNRSKHVASNSALKQNNLKQNQLPLASGEVARSSTVHGRRRNNIRDGIALHEAKGFFSSAKENPNISKTLIIKTKGVNRMDVARKGQSSNNLRGGNASIGKPKVGTQQNAEKDLIGGKETKQVRTKPVGQNPARSDSRKEAELGYVNVVGTPASCIVSFTFSSATKHASGPLNSSDIAEKRGEMKESVCYAVSSTELVDSDAYYQSSSHKETIFRQEMSRNLVERKTGAVDSLDRGDLEKKCDSSVIDRLNHDRNNTSGWTDGLMMSIKNKFQDAAKESTSTALPPRDIDHLIVASFMDDDDNSFSGWSNGTTVSESTFWQNENQQESDFKETSWSENEQKNNPDSANIMTRSDIFQCDVAIQERKLRFSAEALSNAELLLENIYSFGSDRPKDSFVELFFREKIGSILSAFYVSSRSRLNFTEHKAGNQLRNLIDDCVVERLASMHECFYNSGYKSWLKLIGFFTKDRLVSNTKKEIRGWNNVDGKALDFLIDEDLDHLNKISMDFSIESCHIGMRIGDDILQLLIDEIANGCLLGNES